eukprot:9309483-Lingulodinium_polyedra.AAC.1
MPRAQPPAVPPEYARAPQPLVHNTPKKAKGGHEPQYARRALAAERSHPQEAISLHGSNQFGKRMRCMACHTLLLAQPKANARPASCSASSSTPERKL